MTTGRLLGAISAEIATVTSYLMFEAVLHKKQIYKTKS